MTMTPRKRWIIAEDKPKATEAIATALGLEPVLARLLVNRGATCPEEAQRYIDPRLSGLTDPFTIPDMEKAAQRISLAKERGERVMVYGDFDVDGLTGAAALHGFLTESGIKSSVFAPERDTGHRGLRPVEIENFKRDGADLLITVDTGSSSAPAADRASEMGLDLIITDHHIPSEERPRALALVNPHLSSDDVSGRTLSGAGVAFKLMMAVRKTLRVNSSGGGEPNLKRLLALVAMGTVADCLPLTGENRILVRHGLDELSSNGTAPGLMALKAVCKLNGRTVTARDVSFDLAPRLNSASRLNNARMAIDLLTATEAGAASLLAARVDEMNEQRKKIQDEILRQARDMAEALPEEERRTALTLCHDDWDPGVIGIVASRLVDEYQAPVVLVSFSGEEGKGSCRATSSFDMHWALSRAGGALEKFGGHKGAAGLYIRREKYGQFRELFLKAAQEGLAGRAPSGVSVDMALDPIHVSRETAQRLSILEPFGDGAPAPCFLGEGLALASAPQFIGAGGQTVRFNLHGAGGPTQAVGFKLAGQFGKFNWKTEKLDILYTPEINKWGGGEKLQLRILDARTSPREANSTTTRI